MVMRSWDNMRRRLSKKAWGSECWLWHVFNFNFRISGWLVSKNAWGAGCDQREEVGGRLLPPTNNDNQDNDDHDKQMSGRSQQAPSFYTPLPCAYVWWQIAQLYSLIVTHCSENFDPGNSVLPLLETNTLSTVKWSPVTATIFIVGQWSVQHNCTSARAGTTGTVLGVIKFHVHMNQHLDWLRCGAFPVKPRNERGSFRKSLGAAHAVGTPAAVDVRSPVWDPVGDTLWDPVGDARRHSKASSVRGKETAAAAESGFVGRRAAIWQSAVTR